DFEAGPRRHELLIESAVNGLTAVLSVHVDINNVNDLPSVPAPIGASPADATPTGAIAIGAAPTSASPIGITPTGAAPTGAFAIGATPTGADPTNAIAIDSNPADATPTGAIAIGAAPTSASPIGITPTGAAPTGAFAIGVAAKAALVGAAQTGAASADAVSSYSTSIGVGSVGVTSADTALTDTNPIGVAAASEALCGRAASADVWCAVVAEDTARPTALMTLHADDEDGDTLTYRLRQSALDGPFSLDPVTGVLSLTAALDAERRLEHELHVLADDGIGRSGESLIVIVVDNVNEPPAWTPPAVTLPENVALGTVVADLSLATDPEGNTLSYAIISGNSAGLYTLTEAGQLQTAAALDYEAIATPGRQTVVARHRLGLRITDNLGLGADFELIVDISDVDEAPVSTAPSVYTVPENSVVGAVVGTATAVDPEGDAVVYALNDLANAPVSIDAQTGALTLTRAGLDHESMPEINFEIIVSDPLGHTATVVAVLRVTDVNEAPVITAPVAEARALSVFSSLGAGAIVTVVQASDPEDDVLTYSIFSGNSGGLYAVEPTTGIVSLARVVSTAEIRDGHQTDLVIDISDGRLSSTVALTATLTVDAEQLAPRLDGSRRWSVAENLAVGSVIATLMVEDHDLGLSSIGLHSTRDQDTALFSLASDRRLIVRAALDHETATTHTVQVRLVNTVGTFDYQIDIDVTDVDEPPLFADIVADITRRVSSIDTDGYIATITATDPEGSDLSYTLSTGNSDGTFVIDNTGRLSLSAGQTARVLRRPLTVTVSDSGGNSTVANFTVIFLGNSAPQLSLTPAQTPVLTDENGQAPRDLTRLSATDDDGDDLVYALIATGEAGSQTSAGAAERFVVQPNGLIRLIKTLNYEEQVNWTLSVTVSDGIAQINADLQVAVTDRNDPPVITGGLHANGVVPEDAGFATVIRRLSAVDEDTRDTRLKWLLTGVSGEGPDCQPEDYIRILDVPDFVFGGVMRLLLARFVSTGMNSLDREKCDRFTLTVRVLDRVEAFSEGSFTIEVLDVNEPPVLTFDDPPSVAENVPVGSAVIDAISFADPDGGTYGVYYEFNDPLIPFALDSQTGRLTTTRTLDHESISQYPLRIISTICADPDDPSQCPHFNGLRYSPVVCVLDVNEAPALNIPTAEIRVSTRAEAGSVIYRSITVSDPENHPVALSFSAGNGADLFGFESTGTGIVLASVINDVTGVYDLTVQACDVPGAAPAATAQCVGKVRALPYEPQCSTRSLRIRVTNEDVQPPAQPGGIVVSQTQSQSQSQAPIMSDIDIAWNRPPDPDYSHTLIRWTDRNNLSHERRFDVDTSIGTGHRWQPGLEEPAIRFEPGLHRLEMISADTAGNLSAPVRVRVHAGVSVVLPVLLVNDQPLIDLHRYDASLDAGDPPSSYTYTVIEGNGSYDFNGGADEQIESHDRFRTAADTTAANAIKCPAGWLCTHMALAHYYNPDDMPARIMRYRVGENQYTFARTQPDRLTVRLQHPTYRHDFPVTVSPNPKATDINRRCAAMSGTLSRLDHWLCINGREIIPTDMSRTPTKAEVCALPAELRQVWGNDLNSYQLVVSADFNDISEVEKLFNVSSSISSGYWETAPYPMHEVRDGTWIQRYDPLVNTKQGVASKVGITGPLMQSAGKFEFASGYMEVRQLNDIPYTGTLGPFFIIWSRFGSGHSKFSEVPDLSIFDDELLTSSGQGVNLDVDNPLPGPYFLHRSTIGRVGFLEIDFWERWDFKQTGPLWVVHSYPRSKTAQSLTVKHGQRYNIRGNSAWGQKRPYYPLPATGPFVSGLEVNPDATVASNALRFYLRQAGESRTTAAAPTGLRQNDIDANFRDVVSHSSPMKINWLNVRNNWLYDSAPCYAENYQALGTRRLRCSDPLRLVRPGELQWRFDYIRLWKRRGYDITASLTGTRPTPPPPTIFTCPAP
ncbi:MAG: cadherin domain-containing protein, partial [Gammaproteobacteria bacterium]|nr:cadherin domain-containing protein [Gammaproteobacteria bacterium]